MTDEDDIRKLGQLCQAEILAMLSSPTRPEKPVDSNAPLPHWAKRSIQRAWIKAERERRAALTFTGEDLDRLSDKLAAPRRAMDETDADFRNRLLEYFNKLPLPPESLP